MITEVGKILPNTLSAYRHGVRGLYSIFFSGLKALAGSWEAHRACVHIAFSLAEKVLASFRHFIKNAACVVFCWGFFFLPVTTLYFANISPLTTV